MSRRCWLGLYPRPLRCGVFGPVQFRDLLVLENDFSGLPVMRSEQIHGTVRVAAQNSSHDCPMLVGHMT